MDEQIENYYADQMHKGIVNMPELSPAEERLQRNRHSGEFHQRQNSPNFVFDDTTLKKYATEGFNENPNSRNIDIVEDDKNLNDQPYMYKHQPSFSRVSERS